jgi:hypothetical protein
MRGQLKYYDCNMKIGYKLWDIEFWGKVSKELVLDMISLKHVNMMYNEWKKLQRFEVCVYQVYTKGLVKVYHFAQKVREI